MARTANQNTEIQALVESFTGQLTQIVRRTALEQVHAALGEFDGGGRATATATLRRPRATTATRTGGGGKRTSEQVEQFANELLTFVKKNPGQRGEQIAEALKTDVGTMRLPMKTLIAGKKVKTKGQRRGMTYFAA